MKENTNEILKKALLEKDYDTFLTNCDRLIYHVWHSLNLDWYLGRDLKEDGAQEVKIKLLKVMKNIDVNDNIVGYVSRTAHYKLLNFREHHLKKFYGEGVKGLINDEDEERNDAFPYEENFADVLDVERIKEHLDTYKDKKFKKAVTYYLDGYKKKEISKMMDMWHDGLANSIELFRFRVRKLFGEETVDEETFFKEKIRPQFWTYVKELTKRRRVW